MDDLDDDDEFADFLVDDDEGDKPDGEPRRRRRQALARALPAGVSADAFQVHALPWCLQHSWQMAALPTLLWSSRALANCGAAGLLQKGAHAVLLTRSR